MMIGSPRSRSDTGRRGRAGLPARALRRLSVGVEVLAVVTARWLCFEETMIDGTRVGCVLLRTVEGEGDGHQKELEALRARWPRVQWGESHNGFSKIHGCADGDVAVYLNYYADGWKVLGREGLADTAAAVVSAWVSRTHSTLSLLPLLPPSQRGRRWR